MYFVLFICYLFFSEKGEEIAIHNKQATIKKGSIRQQGRDLGN